MTIFEQICQLCFKCTPNGDTLTDIVEHIYYQMEDGLVRYIVRDEKVVAFADYFWLKSHEDIKLYEELGMCPDGKVGDILYINNCVVTGKDKSLIWELLKLRPESESICWKRKNGEIKSWRTHYVRTIEKEKTG